MFQMPRIKDVIPLVNGIFSHMSSYTFKADVSKAQLDYLFVASCAQRCVAPVVDLIHEDKFEELTDQELSQLASMMLNCYKPKWDKLGEIYDIEYDPIHNYLDQWEDETDGSESENSSKNVEESSSSNSSGSSSSTRTDNLSQLETRDLENSNTRTDNLTELETRNLGSSSTRTDNLTELETRNLGNSSTRTDNLEIGNTGTQQNAGSNTDTTALWGFNSTDAVNSDRTTGSNSNTRTDNLTETHTGTVGTVGAETGTKTIANTGTQGTIGTDTGTKSIGNTGTQQNVGEENGTVTIANTGTQGTSGSEQTTGSNTRESEETGTRAGENHRERSGRHFGNIGNLTSQKQIKEEIELWKWNYVQSVLEDAKDFLTLAVYL